MGELNCSEWGERISTSFIYFLPVQCLIGSFMELISSI
jgi:hypothetical protein